MVLPVFRQEGRFQNLSYSHCGELQLSFLRDVWFDFHAEYIV